jgi:lipopolysaccharide biosynthesis glycosyltransferase
MLLKAYPHALGASGTIVLIDSDMIVTRSLEDVVARAQKGGIYVFPDPPPHRGRWFAEWHDELELRAPLRQRTYLNAGFLALSTEHWPELLGRWWELCDRVPREQHFGRFEQPFWAGDQDVLNAILASEVPEDAVVELDAHEEAYPDDLLEAVIVDERTLRCEVRGRPTAILHYALGPKAWERKAWLRLRDDAYVRLLPRLLFGDDVAVRLDPRSVPLWLRPGRSARVLVRGADLAHGGVRRAVHALPRPIRERALALRNSVFRRL